jgi:Fe2+ or Zn2+ uptake regulation protein
MAMPATDHRDLIDALRARGMRVTPQRLEIHDALARLGRHATADEVLRQVRSSQPGLSLPTVYATLDLLVELGAARRVNAASGAALYDPRADAHAHLVCASCGKVEDVELALDEAALLRGARRAGARADAAEVVLRGRCAACAALSSA